METALRLKEGRVRDLSAEALEHARLAMELHSKEHADKARELRDDAVWWSGRIEKSKERIARLRSGK